jgi:hypothetical protein
MSKPPFSPSALEQALPVPVIGPWIARMGYAADLYANPCHPTPTIWFEAFAGAGIRVVASLYKPFNLAEIFHALKGGFRAHGLRKLVAGGHSGRGMGVIQALEEMTPLKQFIKQPGVNFVVLAGDLAIKAEWYLFLVDVTTDGLVNWISQAYQYAGCTSEAGGWAQGTATNVYMLGFDSDLDQAWQSSPDIIAIGPTVLTGKGEIRCSCNINWRGQPGLPPPTFVVPRFVIDGEDSSPHFNSQYDANTGQGYSTAHVTKRSAADSGHIVRCKVGWDGWLLIESAFTQISSSNDMKTNLNPDP